MKVRGSPSQSPRAPSPQAQARAAFTLIELVLALAMVAILSLSLFASVRIAFRAQASAQAAIEPVRTVNLAMDFLRQDFENALPQGDNLAGAFVGNPATDARGNPAASVVLYTTAASPDHPSANGEIKRVELTVMSAADLANSSSIDSVGERRPMLLSSPTDMVLVRRVVRNLLTTTEVTPDDQVICRNVAGFSVRYFDGTDWLDTFDGAEFNSVPLAVEVTLDLEAIPTTAAPSPTPVKCVRVFKLACSVLTSNGLGGEQ